MDRVGKSGSSGTMSDNELSVFQSSELSKLIISLSLVIEWHASRLMTMSSFQSSPVVADGENGQRRRINLSYREAVAFAIGCAVCGGIVAGGAAAGLYFLRIKKSNLAELGKLDRAISALNSDVTGYKRDLFQNASRINALNADVLGYKSDIAQKENTINTLTVDLRVTQEKLRSMEEQLVTFRDHNSKLFEEFKQYKTDSNNDANKLYNSLSSPNVRGMWGEMQLRRTVELLGMHRYCDFEVQPVLADGFRPDMIIKLTNNRCIAVDSKVPLTSFQSAIACRDDVKREELFKSHALAVKQHIKTLSGKQKGYTQGLRHFESPSFVVLFLPSETLYSIALEYDHLLLEYAALKNVCIASPTTLMALLKMVDAGWQREEVNQNSHEIAQLGRELCSRSGSIVDHLKAMGKSLDTVTGHYNKTVKTFESRFLPSARKLSKFNADKEISQLSELSTPMRHLSDRVVSSVAAMETEKDDLDTEMGNAVMEIWQDNDPDISTAAMEQEQDNGPDISTAAMEQEQDNDPDISTAAMEQEQDNDPDISTAAMEQEQDNDPDISTAAMESRQDRNQA